MNFMKTKRALCLALAATACLLTACGTAEHEHTWTSYIAKQPTCTENGIMERICSECSKQVFETIQPVGHTYDKNGVCSVCGNKKDEIPVDDPNFITVPQNADYGYTLQDIHEQCVELGYAYSYEDFLDIICNSEEYNGYIEGFYVDNLTSVHFYVVDEDSESGFALMLNRSNLSAPDPSALKTVYRVSVTNDELLILYSDGYTLNAGKLIGEDDERIIRSVSLTRNLQVLVTYTDDTARFIGKISDGIVPEANSSFIYEACTGGYAIKGVVDHKATHLEIPLTFRGQPVVAIKKSTFTSCDSLSYVVIPDNVKRIEKGALNFYRKSQVNLFFEGSESDYYFESYWNNATAYFKGEWSYNADNVPQAN